jgi:hypothetical protein
MPANIESMWNADELASKITDMWVRWDTQRTPWKTEKDEIRAYLFATDTRKTTNAKLPWKNSTVTPKLNQIRDNLHANYLAALFPSEDWFTWQATEKTDKLREKRDSIVNYMKHKLKASKFELTISQLIYDYIDYGNVLAGHEFVKEQKKDMDTGEYITLYTGPRAFRVSPLDCVFNPLSETFGKSPFIRRILKTIGSFVQDSEDKPYLNYNKAVIQKCLDFRSNMRDDPEFRKNTGLIIDGFGTIEEYLESDCIELLEFWGDVYDPDTQTYHKDRVITVADRRWVLRNEPNRSWLGHRPYYHCGWRLRPDNLWAQGPLDQLVGIQYRIDHLENLKADVFDQIAHPIVKVVGNTVEEFVYQPGETIFCGDEGNVEMLRPDATALQADMQIRELMDRMEELAGAPRQAMGIRTPGEKTKYEVQSLENAAGRIFQSKVQWFERNILEPLLNSMLEEARRNFGGAEVIASTDPEFGTTVFQTLTKEDIVGTGRLFPMGARHFAEQAKFVQELTQTMAAVQQVPSIAAHFSGLAAAKALEENLGWKNYGIVRENIAVFEQKKTQQLINQAGEDLQVEQNIPIEGVDEALPPDQM